MQAASAPAWKAAVALCVAVALLAAIPVAVAEAGFAPARTLTEVAQLDTPDVAVDAQGNALTVWDEPVTTEPGPHLIKARRLTATGTLGPVITVSLDGDNYQSAVAFAPDGRAFVVWRHSAVAGEHTGVEGRWVEPDGKLGELQTFINGDFVTTDVVEPRVAIDDDVVSVLWRDQLGPAILQGRRLGPNGLDSLTSTITVEFEGNVMPLTDGKTLVVWRIGNTLYALVWNANNSLTAPVALSTTPGAYDPQPLRRPDGDAFVVWMHQGPGPLYNNSILGRRFSGAGAPVGGELTIDGDAAPGIFNVAAASDSAGNVLAGWTRQDGSPNTSLVHARRFDAAGNFAGPTQTISPDNNASVFAAALFDRGEGAVAWDADPIAGLPQVEQGRAVDGLSAPLGPVADLAKQPGRSVGDSDAAAGVAAFATRPDTATGNSMVLSRYMVEPICTDVSATVVQGKPIDAPVSCSGPGVNGAAVVTQPKHGKAGAGVGSTLTYTPTPGFAGNDSFTYSGLNDGGGSTPATVSIKVGKDTVKPKIVGFNLFTKRTKPADAAKKKSKPGKTYFALRFSEPATAKVTVEKPTRGVKKGKRCRARGKGGASGKRCTFYKRLGSVSSKTAAPSASIEIKGKLLRKIKGRKGRLRASAVATDPAGNRSNPKPLTIVKLGR